MMPIELAARFGTALGLGLLLGFERQRKQKPNEEQFAGARTFALISLLGASAARTTRTTCGIEVVAPKELAVHRRVIDSVPSARANAA